jgi:3-deoxy-D-manno-octulosonate 8-phosphate phosphatase KdsC-like HAD superfamily phosphatase
MNVAKKTVKEPEVQTMGGELIDEPKAKKTTKKAAPKKAVKKTAKKTTKTAAKTSRRGRRRRRSCRSRRRWSANLW